MPRTPLADSMPSPLPATGFSDDFALDPALPVRRRASLVVLVLIATMLCGYHFVASVIDPSRAHGLLTRFDRAIPFVPNSIFVYSMVYSATTYPLFTVRSERLFLRIARAYMWLMAISFAIYLALPVTSVGLRPDLSSLDPQRFAHWGVRLTYFVDPPTNCFPSLHLSFAVLAMLSAYTARPLWGWVAAPLVLGVAVSILTMKQHYLADAIAATLLAIAIWHYLVRPDLAERPSSERTARTWRGPVLYAALAVSVYGVFFVAFLLGWQPWQG
jgi:hypothetical protein